MAVDFGQAIAKHLHWKIRMRDFLAGKESLTREQVVSHQHCDLGKWYYAEGKSLYGHLPIMQKFESEHENLHRIIKQMVEEKENGNEDASRNLLPSLDKSSDIIVKSLQEAEDEINKV